MRLEVTLTSLFIWSSSLKSDKNCCYYDSRKLFFKEPQNVETKIRKADVKAQKKAQWGFSYSDVKKKKKNVIVIKSRLCGQIAQNSLLQSATHKSCDLGKIKISLLLGIIHLILNLKILISNLCNPRSLPWKGLCI